MGRTENAVMYAVEQVCGLYRVELLRMQSRVFTVPGAAGRSRPMFFGKWKDMKGEEHSSGMADFLARPRIHIGSLLAQMMRANPAIPANGEISLGLAQQAVTLLVWIETKAGKEKMTAEQEAFRHYVQQNGEYYISVKENFDELIAWFRDHGLREGGR
jgi:hypothetical protein